MRSLARLSFAVLTALVMSVCFSATHTALAQTDDTSTGILISEFRFDGPNGSGDEYVEIVNNSNLPKTIVSSDANNLKGWTVHGLVNGNVVRVCTIPFNTLLAPGQHFLCAKTPGYELGGYGAPDANISPDGNPGGSLDADGGVALFTSEDVFVNADGSWASGTGTAFRADAVGFKKLNSATFVNPQAPAVREGPGLNPIGRQDPASRATQNPSDVREYGFVRKHGIQGSFWSGPVYHDSQSNTTDWTLVANIGDIDAPGVTQASLDGAFVALAGSPFDPSPAGFAGTEASTTAIFGAPGPQGTASPIERNYTTQFIRSNFDTGSAVDVSPNRERNGTIVCGGTRGDLILRFTYKNQTTLTQNNLKVRWVDISTINRNNAIANAVVVLLDSTAATRSLFVNGGRDVRTGAAAGQNDPTPSADGITNSVAAGGAGVKTVRGTYVEGVAKTPPVTYVSPNPPANFGFATQNFRQVNPTITDAEGSQGTPCKLGGLNSATVAVGPTAGITTAALPAPLVNNGSISLEHRFGVIRQGTFLLVGIIESN